MSVQGWYPLALAEAIAPGTSAGAVLKGMEIVVWRDSAGMPHAWEDRCPHRGMKMSFGFVRGDHIACLYHGWEYGADGQCRYIPAHPKLEVPKTICATTYGIAESGGMLWAGLGEAGEAPALPEATAIRSLYVEAPLNTVLKALPRAFSAGGVTLDGRVARMETPQGRLVIGLQEVGPDRSALHITVAGDATPETRAGLARAATALRDQIETGAAA